MAGNSPTSTLPGVSRGGGRPGPIGSLTSVTMQSMHSPMGSLSSVNGGVFNSGHFKASPNPTPQAQRRRWCDYTPTEVWPATPSPAGHEAPCGFGVPSSAIAVSTSPSAAASYAFPAAPAQPGAALAAPGHVQPGPMPGMQQGVSMPVTGIPMPVTAGAKGEMRHIYASIPHRYQRFGDPCARRCTQPDVKRQGNYGDEPLACTRPCRRV